MQFYIDKERNFGAHNYSPLPIVLEKGHGIHVWDTNGNKYMDFLSGYSALNQGHCHPKIISAVCNQGSKLSLTSRAFYNHSFGEYAEYMTNLFKYDKLLPMNTGVEAGETSHKLARKWGYLKKQIPENCAKIVLANGNFWGRTLAAVSSSDSPETYSMFGPFMPGYELVPYNDIEILEQSLQDPNVCAFMIEPIQGESGVIIPDSGYLKHVERICNKYNVLFIADEIQTGLGRTGKLLACDHEDVRPDILILGKALSGGVIPVSAVLADNEVMLCIQPGEHGSTFGGNPLACKIAQTAVQVLLEEDMCKNSEVMGTLFRNELQKEECGMIKEIRGRGLLNAIEFKKNVATDVSMKLAQNGLLTKSTRKNILRLSPPLTISPRNVLKAVSIIKHVLRSG